VIYLGGSGVFCSLCAALFIMAQFLLFLLVRTRVDFAAQSGAAGVAGP